MVRVIVPIVLKSICGNQIELEFDCNKETTYGKVLETIFYFYPKMKERIYIDGKFNLAVNHFINQEDIRFIKDLDSPVKDGDELSIVPAYAGGTNVEERRGQKAIYPCRTCPVMRTLDEGGNIFTICEECWEKENDARGNR